MPAKRLMIAAALLLCSALVAFITTAQEAGARQPETPQPGAEKAAPAEEAAEPNPLAPFARLVGGEWHIGPLRHVYEWGIGRRTIHARSYYQAGALASEARWFFHPGEKVIRGYSVDAKGTFLAEMTTRFEGDTLVNELRVIGADGAESTHTGKWVFTDDDRYDWTLWAETPEGPKQTMAASAERRTAAATD